mgnify:FL=1
MQIHVFAVLKDYLPESFVLEKPVANVEELRAELSKKGDEVARILRSCRFAVGNTFINNTDSLNPEEEVYIIPPSSGG